MFNFNCRCCRCCPCCCVGPRGPRGPRGHDGRDGNDGATPYIGENGNWWILEEDTSVTAQGPRGLRGFRGQSGNDGANGATPHIGENGNWWVLEEDTLVKAEGPQGEPGQQGEPGEPGPQSLSSALISFSSGNSVFRVTTLEGGLSGRYAFMGFHSYVAHTASLTEPLDQTDRLGDFSFSVASDCTIKSIAATYKAYTGSVEGDAVINACIYKSAANTAVFYRTDAVVYLAPTVTQVVNGEFYHAVADVNVEVKAGERLIFVVSANNVLPETGPGTIEGMLSGGISLMVNPASEPAVTVD